MIKEDRHSTIRDFLDLKKELLEIMSSNAEEGIISV